MPVRPVTRAEMTEFDQIQTVAFVGTMDPQARAEQHEKDEGTPEKYCYGYFNEENIMTACMLLPEYEIRYEGHTARMVGVGGVASLPEYRHGGAVRQIFEMALAKMYREGVLFTSLYPFSHPYYRKFGYELCQLTLEYTFPTSALASYRFSGKARMYKPGDALDDYIRLYNDFYGGYNMAIVRSEERWKNWARTSPYKDRVYTYLLEGESGPFAYVNFRVERKPGDDGYTAIVHEVAYDGPEALRALLGFLYRLSAQYEKIHLCVPSDIPIPAMLAESYEIEPSYSNHMMARVVHAKQALEWMRHPESAQYTIRILDDGIAENNGAFSVESTASGTRVEAISGDAPVDLTIDVRALSALLLGYLDIDAARYRTDVTVHGNLETLRRVFLSRPVQITEYF